MGKDEMGKDEMGWDKMDKIKQVDVEWNDESLGGIRVE